MLYKKSALMLPLPTEATAEDKTNTGKDQCQPMQIIQQHLDSCIKTHHNQHRQQRGDWKILNVKGSLGH